MYAITALIWSSVSLSLKDGILSLPFLITVASSSFDLVTTIGSFRDAALNALPAGVLPVPSAPWHIRHFVLKVSAPLSCARAGAAIVAARQTIAAWAKFNFTRSEEHTSELQS